MEIAVNPTNGEPTVWSEDYVKLLTKLWADGLSASLIGIQMDLTRNQVIGKVNRLGLTPRRSIAVLAHPRQLNKRRADIDRSMTQRMKTRVGIGPKPPLKIKETLAVVEFRGIPLLELGYRQCRFPRGEGAGIVFCGQVTAPLQSYCPHCCGIVYRKPGHDA